MLGRTVSPGERARLMRKLTPYALTLPVILYLALIIVYPMGYAFLLSFSDIDMRLRLHPVGFENFQRVLAEPLFWKAALHSVVFTASSVLLQFLCGFGIALLLNTSLAVRKLFRVIFVIPWAVPPVIVGTIFVWMYHPQYGILNEVLVRLGLLSEYLPWLASVNLAMLAVLIANVWRGTPFVMLMLLAGLQAIPQEQYEAARVDGAGSVHSFWYVTLPNLRYVATVVLVLNTIWNFKFFDLIQVMTGGGPAGATEILPTLIYRMAFQYTDFGGAAAIAVLMFILLAAIITFYMRYIQTEMAGETR